MFAKIQSVAKFLVALVGAGATYGTTFIPAEWGNWLGLALALLTAVATYVVPNTPAVSVDDAIAADRARSAAVLADRRNVAEHRAE